MAEPSKSTGFGIIWPSVILAVVTSSAILALKPSLDSARPQLTTEADLTELPTANGTLATYARPWEDPLTAAREHYRKQKEPCLCINDLQKVINGFVKESEKTVVLTVWLRGGPYDDDKEQRLRTRYAVENALMAEGLTLNYPERLTYTVLSVSVKITPHKQGEEIPQSIVVPIKLYTRESGNNRKAIALWVSESDLGDTP